MLDYLQFREVINLGITVNSSEVCFDKLMVYSFIKEALENGRKN